MRTPAATSNSVSLPPGCRVARLPSSGPNTGDSRVVECEKPSDPDCKPALMSTNPRVVCAAAVPLKNTSSKTGVPRCLFTTGHPEGRRR